MATRWPKVRIANLKAIQHLVCFGLLSPLARPSFMAHHRGAIHVNRLAHNGATLVHGHACVCVCMCVCMHIGV